jgi:hypothetical protein
VAPLTRVGFLYRPRSGDLTRLFWLACYGLWPEFRFQSRRNLVEAVAADTWSDVAFQRGLQSIVATPFDEPQSVFRMATRDLNSFNGKGSRFDR